MTGNGSVLVITLPDCPDDRLMLASKVVVGPGRGEVLTDVELEELDAMFPPAPSVSP
jgi:hypothetical protein